MTSVLLNLSVGAPINYTETLFHEFHLPVEPALLVVPRYRFCCDR